MDFKPKLRNRTANGAHATLNAVHSIDDFCLIKAKKAKKPDQKTMALNGRAGVPILNLEEVTTGLAMEYSCWVLLLADGSSVVFILAGTEEESLRKFAKSHRPVGGWPDFDYLVGTALGYFFFPLEAAVKKLRPHFARIIAGPGDGDEDDEVAANAAENDGAASADDNDAILEPNDAAAETHPNSSSNSDNNKTKAEGFDTNDGGGDNNNGQGHGGAGAGGAVVQQPDHEQYHHNPPGPSPRSNQNYNPNRLFGPPDHHHHQQQQQQFGGGGAVHEDDARRRRRR